MEPRPLGRGMSRHAAVRDVGVGASMEPRPLGRGMFPPAAFRGPYNMLQWSHDLSVVECVHDALLSLPLYLASMEPRPLGRGMYPPRRIYIAGRYASMEPRPLGRGMLATRVRQGMEPGRFNGATTSRSWNVHHHVGGLGGPLASMEPRPLGRGMQRHDADHGCPADASMEPRPLGRGMSWHLTGRVYAAVLASMEPRPLGRGMLPSGSGSSRRYRRFNGATTSRSWNVFLRER